MDLRSKWSEVKRSRFFEEFYFFALALILAFGVIQTTGTILETDRPVVTVVSCSMYPHYDVGDLIMVRGEDFNQIEEGDIIVFDTETSDVSIPVIHRVIKKEENSLETKGDNNRGQSDFEKDISPDQIYGSSYFRVPKIGLVKILAMDLTGLTGSPGTIDATPQCRNRP